MIWFKHLANALSDEMLRDLRGKYGWEGYGRWWAVVEAVALQMKPNSDRCHLEMSVKDWCALLEGMPKTILPFLFFLADHKDSTISIKVLDLEGNKFEVPNSFQNGFKTVLKRFQTGFKIILRIPKLLELRDTRNSMRPQRGGKEVEVDVEKEKIKKEKKSGQKKPAGAGAKEGVKTPLKDQADIMHKYHETESVPDGWEEWARKKGVTVKVRPIFESFCQNHLKRESMWVNWYSVWQKWISNAREYNPEYFILSTHDKKVEALYQDFAKEISADYDPEKRDEILNRLYDVLCAQVRGLGYKPLTPKEIMGKYVKK